MKHQVIIGFTCGAFDLTHAGHYLMFEECRSQCDYLVVGLQEDPSIDRPNNKNKPIQSVQERKLQLRACRWIDKVVIYKTEKHLVKILEEIKPSIRFIGKDWEGKNYTGRHLPIKVIFNSRNHNYSSTSLRERVVKQCQKD